MNYTYKSFSSDDTLNFAKNLASKIQKKRCYCSYW